MRMRLSVFSVLLGICLVSWGQVGDLPRSHAEDEGMSSELVKSFVHHLANLPEVDVHHLMMLRQKSGNRHTHVSRSSHRYLKVLKFLHRQSFLFWLQRYEIFSLLATLLQAKYQNLAFHRAAKCGPRPFSSKRTFAVRSPTQRKQRVEREKTTR